MYKNRKWRTTYIDYVDVETGEIISRKNVTNKEYSKQKKTINYGNESKTITYECKWNGQKKLF